VTYDDLARDAQTLNLNIVGICQILPEDNMPSKYKSLVLLGPDIQTFWPHFINQVEYLDGDPDPLDRWSVRIISGWAKALKAKAVYPLMVHHTHHSITGLCAAAPATAPHCTCWFTSGMGCCCRCVALWR
jgi:hypothetical protein